MRRFLISCGILAAALVATANVIVVQHRPSPLYDVDVGPLPVIDKLSEYLYDQFTNAAGRVEDTSGSSNDGFPGSGGAQPAWFLPTNRISAYTFYDGGDSVTSIVESIPAGYSVWAMATNGAWTLYTQSGTNQYVGGIAGVFVLSDFVTTNVGYTNVWGQGYTGSQDAQILFTNAPVGTTNFWYGSDPATNHGWSIIDYEDQSTWSNYALICNFNMGNIMDDTSPYHISFKTSGTLWPSWQGHTNTTSGHFRFADDTVTGFGNHARFQITGNLTIAAWIHNIDGVNQNIWVSKDNAASRCYDLIIADNTGVPNFQVFIGNVANQLFTPAVPYNKWIHHCGVFDNDNDTMYYYTNGVLSGIKSNVVGNIDNDPALFALGSRSDGAFRCDGSLDELRIGPIALSSNQVYDLWNKGRK